MTNSPNGLPAPDLGDSNNPPADFLALANAIDAAYGGAVANAAALPASGDFPGQRKFLTATKEVAVWNGTSWGGYWQDYTPTITGIAAVGSTAKWIRQGGLVTVEYNLVASGAATGTIVMSTPSTFSNISIASFGTASFYDASVGTTSRRGGTVLGNSDGNSVLFLVDSTGGSIAAAGVPYTWAVSDFIRGMFQYREA